MGKEADRKEAERAEEVRKGGRSPIFPYFLDLRSHVRRSRR
jgi:hypothetical protein